MLYLAALLMVLGVAGFVAAPFFTAVRRENEDDESERIQRLDHERGLALQGLRDLEFDQQMHKLSDADSGALRAELERRAISAMSEIEWIADAGRRTERAVGNGRVDRTETVRSASDRVRFCPECGTRRVKVGKFCAGCGMALKDVPAPVPDGAGS